MATRCGYMVACYRSSVCANLSLAFCVLRGDCSDQHCGPERAWWIGQLGMLDYYIYSINHGQESACGSRVQTHRLTLTFLYNHV